jgi:hypothetical protein
MTPHKLFPWVNRCGQLECCDPCCRYDCKTRRESAACRPVSPGREKPPTASSVTRFPPHIARYVLAKFLFHKLLFDIRQLIRSLRWVPDHVQRVTTSTLVKCCHSYRMRWFNDAIPAVVTINSYWNRSMVNGDKLRLWKRKSWPVSNYYRGIRLARLSKERWTSVDPTGKLVGICDVYMQVIYNSLWHTYVHYLFLYNLL